jgi:hypothetical protein
MVSAAASGTCRGDLVAQFEQLRDRIDECLSETSIADTSRGLGKARADLESQGRSAGQAIAARITQLISDPAVRLNGAQRLAAHLIQQYRAAGLRIQEQVHAAVQAIQAADLRIRQALTARRISPESLQATIDPWRSALRQHLQDKLSGQLSVVHMAKIVGQLLDCESKIGGWIESTRKRLAGRLPLPPSARPASEFPTAPIIACLESRLPEWIERVDASLQHGWLNQVGGLAQVMTDLSLGNRLEEEVRRACQQTIARGQNELRWDELVAAAAISPERLRDWLTTQLGETKPPLVECGGQIRAVIGHAFQQNPQGLLHAAAQSHSTAPPTVVPHQNGDFYLCHEQQQIPLANLVYRLMEQRADAIDLVARLHTRTNVDWTSLHELFQHA